MEPYLSGQLRLIDNPDHQCGNDSVWTRTWTRTDGPELLLTLLAIHINSINTIDGSNCKAPAATHTNLNAVIDN
jgi:hypothetical protein